MEEIKSNDHDIHRGGDRKSYKMLHEDDGFFSDVSLKRRSLPKSVLALNKYVKSNLLYENVDHSEDPAYFSKETSPNDSVVKSDSESVKSIETIEIKPSQWQGDTVSEILNKCELQEKYLENRKKSIESQSENDFDVLKEYKSSETKKLLTREEAIAKIVKEYELDSKNYKDFESDIVSSPTSSVFSESPRNSWSAKENSKLKGPSSIPKNSFDSVTLTDNSNTEGVKPSPSPRGQRNIYCSPHSDASYETSNTSNAKAFETAVADVTNNYKAKVKRNSRSVKPNKNETERDPTKNASGSSNLQSSTSGNIYTDIGELHSKSNNTRAEEPIMGKEAKLVIVKTCMTPIESGKEITTPKEPPRIPRRNCVNIRNMGPLRHKIPDDMESCSYSKIKPSIVTTPIVEQTDDYKFMQIQERPKPIYMPDAQEKLDVNNRRPHLSLSSNNLNTMNDVEKIDDTAEDKIVYRQKLRDNYEDHRHTLNDFSEWVNRTNKYPDVYAPLPYKSPRRYVESDVNIHYRVPVRHDPLPLVPERELARQQAEHMKRLYREQKRNKYLQENDISPSDIEAFDASIKELQDMQSRRHQDNFLPNQKSIVPLNRYDEAERIVARALYAFNGQTARELSFRKGDLINVRRQIDANWYEGELHGRIGLLPYNYVEILKGDVAQTPKKPAAVEGRARAKFDFTAQTNLELPLKKGELVVLTRRIDHNWWEGRNGTKIGIFPDSYVTVLQEPSQNKPEAELIVSSNKPAASPAAHGLVNGSVKRSMGSHSYTPQLNSPALSNAPQPTQPLLPSHSAKSPRGNLTPSELGYGPPTTPGVDLNNREPLYVDTNAEAIPYRAMYKYRPQNPDELELNEGDTVYVLEQCDDGWYVGSSQRTGRFGTFPGNYVERI